MSSTETGQNGERDESNPRVNTKDNDYNGSRKHTGPRNFRISNFKGEVPEVGAVIGTKSENRTKDSMKLFQNKIASYVLREYKKGRDIVTIIKKIEEVDTSKWKPTAPASTGGKVPESEMMEYKLLYNEYLTRKSTLEDNKGSLHSLVKGQCTPSLLSELKGLEEYEEKDAVFDVVWLLTQINLIVSGVEQRTQNAYELAFMLLKGFFSLRQHEHETLDDYLDRFREAVQTLEFAGINIFDHDGLINLETKRILALAGQTTASATADQKTKAKETAAEAFKAVCLLENADPKRFLSLFNDLRKDMIKKQDNFPRNVVESFDMLNRWRPTNRMISDRNRSNTRVGHMYAQRAGPPQGTTLVPGKDGSTRPVQCYSCNAWGHISPNCPENESEQTGRSLLQIGKCLTQCDVNKNMLQGGLIDKNWLLLDSCSTMSCICNKELVENITTCKDTEVTRVYTNGGHVDYTRKANLQILPFEVFFNESSMANILSLKDVASKFKITMDTSIDRAMTVHINEHTLLRFQECSDGLYYLDTSTIAPKDNNVPVISYCNLQTVNSNKKYFSRREVQGADRARSLQQLLWWPSESDFKKLVTTNILHNCRVTPDDIRRARIIYGPALPTLKGKMIHTNPGIFQPIPRVNIPAPIINEHRNISLQIDFCFINGAPFLHTVSEHINYRTTQPCTSRGRLQILRKLAEVQHKYHRRGFNITDYHADNEFDKIADDLLPATTHIRAALQHTERAERSIRTLKERVRSMVYSTPYRRMPRIMIKKMVQGANDYLNYIPSENGIGGWSMSPAGIVDGKGAINCDMLKLQFGAYVQLYRGTDNTTTSRSVGAIALTPSNEQGGYWFMSLKTGHKLHGYKWVELPISDEVIRRVEQLAAEQGQPLMENGPIFEWTPGEIIADPDDDIDMMAIEMEGVHYRDEEDDHNDIMNEDDDDDDERGRGIIISPTVVTDEDDVDHSEDDDEYDEDRSFEEESPIEEPTQHVHEQEEELDVELEQEEDENIDGISFDTEEDVDEPGINPVTGRPIRANAGAGVVRLEPSMGGKTHENTRVQFTQMSAREGIKNMGK